MRILIIQPDYYPKQTPRVFRWQALAEHWAAKNWEVDVLCAVHSKCPAMEVIHGVTIYRIGQASLKDLFYNFFNLGIRRREIQKVKLTHKVKREGIVFALGNFLHQIWKNIYWPDGACIWIIPGQKKAMHLLKTNSYDAVISVSLPFSSHLVGLSIKRRFPNIKWIVDIGDPFSTLEEFPKNNLSLYKNRNRKQERKVLEKADAISLTMQRALVDFHSIFPGQASKLHIIPPLHALAKKQKVQAPILFAKGLINVGYFGSFYSGIRQPEPLLDLFGQLFEYKPEFKSLLRIHIFGYLEPEFYQIFHKNDFLNGSLLLHGQIDKKLVNQIMNECDFLVNVGNTTTSQLPSKSVDYMMAGKPIINICQIHEDTFSCFLKDYPIILNLVIENGNFSTIQIEMLSDFVNQKRGRNVEKDWIKRKIGEFSTETIAKRYEFLMDSAD